MTDDPSAGSPPPDSGTPGTIRPPLLASRSHTARFLMIVGGIAIAGYLQARRSTPSAGGSRVGLYVSIATLESLFVWFVFAGVRRRGGSFAELIGRRWLSPLDGVRDAALAVALTIALHYLSPFLDAVLGRPVANTAFLMPHGIAESALWVVLAAVAGVCEEIVFRGYLQRQLWALTGSLPLAVLLQAVIFGVGHIYQGWRPAVITAVYGLCFGLVAAWRRSIVPGAIAHAMVDVLGGLT